MDVTTEDFPPTSPPLPDDYSDVDSVHSEDDAAAERQKFQRGGRKNNTTKHTRESRLPPVPEPEIAAEPKHREDVKMDQADIQVNGTVCPECAARKQKTEQKQPTPFETGIRAFNLKRAASSGGRPVGVRTTTSESKKSKKKAPKKKKKKEKVEVKETESEEESSSEEEEDKEPEAKPMSIRLDLNLVIEIFLKAKIQGDVTITFL
jgi:hypothetical protein